jgi:hypothetical protein
MQTLGAGPELPLIGFDFDGTLNRISELYVRKIQELTHYSYNEIWPDMFSTGFKIAVPGKSSNWVWKNVIIPGLDGTRFAHPEKRAVQLAMAWRIYTGQPVTVITCRRNHGAEARMWLDRHISGAIDLHVVDEHHEKLEVIQELGLTDFIEDRYKNCKQLADAGVTVWMPEQPWNTNRPTPAGVFLGSWDDIVQYYTAFLRGRTIGGTYCA